MTPIHLAQSTEEGPGDWPVGVRPISIDGLGHMGVADDGQLYWDGKPVTVGKRFDLTKLQVAYGVCGLIIAATGTAATVVSAYVDWRAEQRAEATASTQRGTEKAA